MVKESLSAGCYENNLRQFMHILSFDIHPLGLFSLFIKALFFRPNDAFVFYRKWLGKMF